MRRKGDTHVFLSLLSKNMNVPFLFCPFSFLRCELLDPSHVLHRDTVAALDRDKHLRTPDPSTDRRIHLPRRARRDARYEVRRRDRHGFSGQHLLDAADQLLGDSAKLVLSCSLQVRLRARTTNSAAGPRPDNYGNPESNIAGRVSSSRWLGDIQPNRLVLGSEHRKEAFSSRHPSKSPSSITTMAIPRSANTFNCSRSAYLVIFAPGIPFFEKRIPNRDLTESSTRASFAKQVKSVGLIQSLHSQTKYRPSSDRKSKLGPSKLPTTS